MKSRQNRMNGGIIGNEDYLDLNNTISTSQNYTRNIGVYAPDEEIIPYTRPTEWVTLPAVTAGSQQLVGVFAVYNNDSNFLAFTCRGAYQVDWGDGTSNTYADNTTAYKVYNTSTYSGLTSSVYKEYKTLVVIITPQSGQTLTSINLGVKHNQSTLSNYINQWLDIRVAGSSLTSFTVGSDTIWPALLEQYEFIGTNQITNFLIHLANARSLQNIVNIYTDNATSMQSIYSNCYSLQQVPLHNTSNVTNFASMFQNCRRLRKIPPFDTSKATAMDSMFADCKRITSIPALNTSLVTSMQNMFNGCNRLETIPWLDTRRVTNMQGLFGFCSRLNKVPFINTSSLTNARDMFAYCTSLIILPPLDFSKVTNFFSTFGNSSLRKIGPIDVSSATSISFMFAYGTNLREIEFTKPTTNISNFSYTFAGCEKLTKIKNLNTINATNVGAMFANSANIDNLTLNFGATWTNAEQLISFSTINSIGNTYIDIPNVTSIFGFMWSNSLITELPPINAPKCLNFGSAFRAGNSLLRIGGLTLPTGISMASFNSVGFNDTFRDCESLITIPPIDFSGITTASSHANVYSNMLLNCRSLSSLFGCTGIQHNFSIAGCKFGATALNDLYQSLAVVGASGSNTKTITVTSNWGAANDDPNIAIAKGWAVSG